MDRTPGSFIEEKEFSLAWHYRKADPELGIVRARELKDALLHLIANLNLGVLDGSELPLASQGAAWGVCRSSPARRRSRRHYPLSLRLTSYFYQPL